MPAYASSGTASLANDADYNTYWRSSGVPATLAYDLSSVSASHRSSILLAWYNDASYPYDHALYGWVGYNNPGSYTVEVNAAAGGGAPPTSGWVVVTTVTGNTLHSKEHVFNFTGYNWVRMSFSVSDGSPGNTDITVNMDVYDASNGVGDGWFFAGDSITANSMDHDNLSTVTSDSFGNQVGALVGTIPPQENAGMPAWTTSQVMAYLPTWLRGFPGKYVTLNLGTNDAVVPVSGATYYANMAAMIEMVLSAGKIPVVPTIPWARDAAHAAVIPLLNAQIPNLYAAYPSVVKGPDLYTFFYNNQSYINTTDNIHPTDAGYAALRALWAQTAASSVY